MQPCRGDYFIEIVKDDDDGDDIDIDIATDDNDDDDGDGVVDDNGSVERIGINVDCKAGDELVMAMIVTIEVCL